MITLEHLRKVSKIKLIFMSLATLLPITILVLMLVFKSKLPETAPKELTVVSWGIFVLLEGYIGIKIQVYVRILLSADYAEAELIKKNDERNKFIRLKTDSFSIKVAIYSLGIALIVSAFLNRIVFYTLLAVVLVYLITYIAVKIYYSKKY